MASKQYKRKPSTFVQRTNAHFKAIERQINPQPRFGSVEGDPPAITNQGKFIDRIVLVSLDNDNLTTGGISKALKSSGLSSTGASGDFYIRTIKMWGFLQTNNSNAVAVKFRLATLLVAGQAGGNSDTVVVQDYGTGSRRPGVRCSIPLPAAILQDFNTNSDIIIAETSGVNCVHVSVRQKL